jgi:cyclopropane-fatty-acyl-phospholipid synthase
VDGLWEADDLVAALAWGARARSIVGFSDSMTAFGRRLGARAAGRRNRPRNAQRSKRNATAHYDLGNDFYRLWLDESMTYSCAVFESPNQPLEAAQAAKHRMMAAKARIPAGGRVLDIGCGWGAFARFAAREYDCHVTGVTLSPSQLELARERVAAEGLNSRVALELEDYRAVTGKFDAIVSIGMFEHVGAPYWQEFFRRCAALLPRGGRLALQTITVPDHALRGHVANVGWIQQNIFPGAVLPSLAAIERAASPAGFLATNVEDIGLHYATTLHHWRERFRSQLPAIRSLGHDDRFIRRWDYYLALSEAGFLTRTTSDVQVVLEKIECSQATPPHG